MHPDKLHYIDLKILDNLHERGSTKRNELGEQVNLSIPSVSERMQKMERAGVIRSYNAVVDARKVGLEVLAFIILTTESPKYYDEIRELALANKDILECHTITGEGSHLIKARTKGTASLENLLNELQSWPGVTNTRTSVVLSSPKECTSFPLKYYKSGL